VTDERLEAYAEGCARAARRVSGWLDAEGPGLPEVFLYAHPEDLERALGDCPLAWANPVGSRVHALLADGVPDDGGAALARATALELWGEPAEPWMLEGIGVAAAGSWWGRPVEDWLAHLERAGALPGEEDAPWTSEHARAPARAQRFLELATRGGPEGVAALWKSGGTAEDEPAEADPSPAAARVTPESGETERVRLALSDWRGFALEDAGAGGLRSSYAARAADELLGRVRELGANAVSFRVEATLEPHRPAVARVDEPAVHGSVADAALVHGASRARSLGLQTLWVVQPLGGPNGTRADAFGLIDPQDQRAFFGRLERIGVHYACLAELAGVDVLCLGAGLDSAAGTAGLDPESRRLRKEDWKATWTRLRPIFGGSWTYASSSLAAARAVEFWDELDLVALESWPAFPAPLATSEPGDVARLLRAEIDGARELGTSAGRRVLWIQAGFPACDLGWQSSRVPRGAPDPESQRRFFAGLRLALDAGVAAPFAGFLVWNVPAAAGEDAPRDADGTAIHGPYSVLGRPAETELPTLFQAP
jgi:hypothetical protein